MAIVEYGKLKVELRASTNADARARERIVAMLVRHYEQEERDLLFHFRIFGRLNTQTISAENLPFPLSRDMTEEELVRNWECFDNMPEAFTDRLWNVLAELLRPIDEATGPEALSEDTDPKAGRGGK